MCVLGITGTHNGKTDNGEDLHSDAEVQRCMYSRQEKGATFIRDMIVVGGRQTWPDVTLTMILSDTWAATV